MTRPTQAPQGTLLAKPLRYMHPDAKQTLLDAYMAIPANERPQALEEIMPQVHTSDEVEIIGNRLGRLSHEMARRPMHQWGSAEIAEHGRRR